MRGGQDDVGLVERAAAAVTVWRFGQTQGDHEAVRAEGSVIAPVDCSGRRGDRRRDKDGEEEAGRA
jgi:hypothetical protein